MPNTSDNSLEKTKELFVYICHKLGDQSTFGSVVLNKVFYYLDHIWYARTGETITLFDYVKQSKGPTPKPSQFLDVRQSLIDNDRIKIEERDYYSFHQKVHKALTKANLELFSPEEVEYIDEIIDVFKDINAAKASYITHQLSAWKVAKNMEDLPPFTFLIRQENLTNEDIDWAEEVIQEYTD